MIIYNKWVAYIILFREWVRWFKTKIQDRIQSQEKEWGYKSKIQEENWS